MVGNVDVPCGRLGDAPVLVLPIVLFWGIVLDGGELLREQSPTNGYQKIRKKGSQSSQFLLSVDGL